MDALLVITSLPDAESARALAVQLVEQRVAACVNIMSPCHSIFRWEGKVDESEEVPLLIKTSAARYAALEEAIRAYHPYELPEIVAVRIEKGLPAYLAWLAASTSAQ
jgi:periplasmic divalent cation tolerance protein